MPPRTVIHSTAGTFWRTLRNQRRTPATPDPDTAALVAAARDVLRVPFSVEDMPLRDALLTALQPFTSTHPTSET